VNGECSWLRDLSVTIKLFVETVEGYGGGIASVDPKIGLSIALLNDDVLPSVASPGFCCARLKGIPVGGTPGIIGNLALYSFCRAVYQNDRRHLRDIDD
jgi:hypothetical protein